jgi:hypothetical protein
MVIKIKMIATTHPAIMKGQNEAPPLIDLPEGYDLELGPGEYTGFGSGEYTGFGSGEYTGFGPGMDSEPDPTGNS